MTTKREQILEAIKSTLNTGTPVGVAQVQRERVNPFAEGALPVNRLIPLKEVVRPAGSKRGKVVLRVLRVGLESYSIGTSAAVDSSLAWFTSALSDARLGGLSMSIEEEETEWQNADLELDFVKATAVYAVEYRTHSDDQEQT